MTPDRMRDGLAIPRRFPAGKNAAQESGRRALGPVLAVPYVRLANPRSETYDYPVASLEQNM